MSGAEWVILITCTLAAIAFAIMAWTGYRIPTRSRTEETIKAIAVMITGGAAATLGIVVILTWIEVLLTR